MAKPRINRKQDRPQPQAPIPESKPTGPVPDVQFERSDVHPAELGRAVVLFTLLIVGASIGSVWFGKYLGRVSQRSHKTDLPPAAVDRAPGELPPEPRLEAIEDVEAKQWQLFPPRYQAYAAKRQGSAKPIEEAISSLSEGPHKLPNRPQVPVGGK